MIFYEDFDLRIRSDGDAFVVSAQRGAQVASESLVIERDLFRDIPPLEGTEFDAIQRYGAALFDALIRGRVRDLYQQGRGRGGGDAAAGLRIRLIFDPRDRRLEPLIRLPWEILRDGSADGNDLPALDARRPIVRMIETVEEQAASAGGPLQRVLLALANPVCSDELDLKRERAAVEAGLARIPLRPDILTDATRARLFDRISDTDAQIVHFMGHCDVDPATGEGMLLLEDEDGNEDRLPGPAFARYFIGKTAPRLVILTCCLSGVPGRRGQPFTGVAFALVAAGLPAVIAMQSSVRDDSAIRFSERLYARLAYGDPIEAAVADARRALSVGRLKTLDWAAPVLFMREESAAARPSVASVAIPPQIPIGNIHITANSIGSQTYVDHPGSLTMVHHIDQSRKADER